MSRPRFVPIIVGAFALHAAAGAAQQAPALRALASFQGDSIEDLRTAPSGRFVLVGTRTGLWMYEVASGRSWKLADGSAWEMDWSDRGDRIVYVRTGDGGTGEYVWTMPVDAETGRSRGPAQRVATGQGDAPAISPDGRFLAFAADDSGQAQRLTVLPVTGGPERLLGRFPRGLDAISWSLDGRALYLGADAPGTTTASVLKVRISGGAPSVIRSRNEWIAGVTADRRHIVLVPVKARVAPGDQATIIDTTGREVGHVPLPVGDIVEYGGVLGDSALVWNAVREPKVLEVQSLDGGSARRLPVVGESDDDPLWSPDGRQIAFVVPEGGRQTLAVMDSDGANARVFRETDVNPFRLLMGWSPDSRSLVFESPDRHRLSLLDVASGTIHTLAQDRAKFFGILHWRADGSAVVVSLSPDDGGHGLHASIAEVTVNGQRRILGRVGVKVTGVAFVGGASQFIRADSTAYLRSLDSQTTRRLADVPPGTMVDHDVESADHQWVMGIMNDSRWIEVFSVATGARTVVEVPFTPVNGVIGFSPLHDAPSFLVFGRPAGENVTKLYRVPLNGDAPQAIADVDGATYALSVSPDGRSVAYPVQAEPSTQTLELIDLRGAVPGSASRGSRP